MLHDVYVTARLPSGVGCRSKLRRGENRKDGFQQAGLPCPDGNNGKRSGQDEND